MMFADRLLDAGRQLARRLHHLASGDVVVLGLPRSGVIVAAEVARVLRAPLDVIVVRKLPTPNQPELGLGAIGEDGISVLNEQVIRTALPGGTRPRRRPRHLAVPVGSSQALVWLSKVADEVVCVNTDEYLLSIGSWYRDFPQVTDEQVTDLLQQAGDPWTDRQVSILAGTVDLPGRLTTPDHASGIVVFAHGSGSSRHSPRNQYNATLLNRAGLGTLLFDLLTPDEEGTRRNVFDIDLLADRLHTAVA
jgi:putative phosphoribosyl transferase